MPKTMSPVRIGQNIPQRQAWEVSARCPRQVPRYSLLYKKNGYLRCSNGSFPCMTHVKPDSTPDVVQRLFDLRTHRTIPILEMHQDSIKNNPSPCARKVFARNLAKKRASKRVVDLHAGKKILAHHEPAQAPPPQLHEGLVYSHFTDADAAEQEVMSTLLGWLCLRYCLIIHDPCD